MLSKKDYYDQIDKCNTMDELRSFIQNETPPVMGGQGRTAEEITDTATIWTVITVTTAVFVGLALLFG